MAGKARTAFGMVLYYLWLRSAKIRGPRSGRGADGGTDGMAGGGHDFDAVLKQFLHALLSIFGSGPRKVVAAVVMGVRGSGFRLRVRRRKGGRAGGWRPKQGRQAAGAGGAGGGRGGPRAAGGRRRWGRTGGDPILAQF